MKFILGGKAKARRRSQVYPFTADLVARCSTSTARLSVALHHFSLCGCQGGWEAEGTQPSHWLPFTSPQQNTAKKREGGRLKKKDRKEGRKKERKKKKNTRATETKGRWKKKRLELRWGCVSTAKPRSSLIIRAKCYCACAFFSFFFFFNICIIPYLIVAKSEVVRECGFESINKWLFLKKPPVKLCFL